MENNAQDVAMYSLHLRYVLKQSLPFPSALTFIEKNKLSGYYCLPTDQNEGMRLGLPQGIGRLNPIEPLLFRVKMNTYSFMEDELTKDA